MPLLYNTNLEFNLHLQIIDRLEGVWVPVN